jgi:hypothetical protein
MLRWCPAISILAGAALFLPPAGASIGAQSVAVSAGPGWRYRECGGGCLRTTRDGGLSVKVRAGVPVVEALDLGVQAEMWRQESERFYILAPAVRWRPSSVKVLSVSAAVGAAFRGINYLCPLPAPEDCGGRRYQRSWVAGLTLDVTAPVDWAVRPILEGSYSATLGPLGSQPPARQDVSLYSLRVGFSLGTP